MASPVRFTSGVTQAAKYQPLGELGIPDPFYYAYYDDDFLPYNAAVYTVTATGGSIAPTVASGPGGRILITTGAVAGNFGEIQLPAAGLQYVAGKKLAYLVRIQGAAVSTQQWVLGLINTTATPFTGGSITDGIYFSKAPGSTNIVLQAVKASVSLGTVTITNANLANNSDIDIGFYVDRLGNIKAFYGTNLEGAKRENFVPLGPMAGILATALSSTLSTALLNPTLAVSNGATAAATTAVSDFMFAGMER